MRTKFTTLAPDGVVEARKKPVVKAAGTVSTGRLDPGHAELTNTSSDTCGGAEQMWKKDAVNAVCYEPTRQIDPRHASALQCHIDKTGGTWESRIPAATAAVAKVIGNESTG